MPSGCRGKPAMNKHRMNKELSSFAARLREAFLQETTQGISLQLTKQEKSLLTPTPARINSIRSRLNCLRFNSGTMPRIEKFVRRADWTPRNVGHWTQIPAVPASAFQELELTSLAPDERTSVFYSSGTTGQKPSRHFHNAESLAVYEASLWTWFEQNIFADSIIQISKFKFDRFDPAARASATFFARPYV